MHPVDAREVQSRTARWREAARLIRSQVRIHPRPFMIAVSGAAVFALCTVASTAAIRWVVDRAILPRFDQGRVAVATALTGLGAIIAIGLIRAAGVIVRRSWAGRAHRRIGESLSGLVIDRLLEQGAAVQHRERKPS